MTTPHPEQTLRLFPLHGPAALPQPGEPVSDFVIGRLLEEGEEADLRWLTRQVSEPRLADWLQRRGSRQLSRRSYLFWSRLLELPVTSERNPVQDALWPL